MNAERADRLSMRFMAVVVWLVALGCLAIAVYLATQSPWGWVMTIWFIALAAVSAVLGWMCWSAP